MKKAFIILILIAVLRQLTFAQEVITGLYENPVVQAGYEQLVAKQAERNISDAKVPINLPFFDDFHQAWIYPDENRWIDNEAYINSNFGYHSATIGVATLDAIDSKGVLHSNASQFPFLADSLTTRPIRLDSLFEPVQRSIKVSDSLYLSFFYQPQGRAKSAPEGRDSLILQFGYFTGDSLFANKYDSIFVPASVYILPDDTINKGDTIFAPPGCSEGIYIIAKEQYLYEDQILMPCDSVFVPEFKWQRIWSSKGMTLEDFYVKYGIYSKQVMIPITDSLKYFKKDFQFRFINWASLASDNLPSWRGNCDEWNIDYVYLNTGRSHKDTVYRDVSFVERAPSLLKNYESMPYNQFSNNSGNEMKDRLEMVISNLDSTIFNSTYYYVVYQVDGPFQYLYPGGNCNLFPFYLNGYQNCTSCAAHACPPVSFNLPVSVTADSAEFEIRHYILGDITPTDTVGDTISYRQKFFNYYAYDDGTPEQGYGLTPAGSMLAYRFDLNIKDTLRAIQMFFNHTQNNANEQFFNLMVWRDNNGKPGDVLYEEDNVKVEYTSGLLGFHTYFLNTPILVNGTFYIGWVQQTNDNLNLGYDNYNNAQSKIYYNSTGEWFQSIYQGALLMRPMLGKAFELSGVGDNEDSDSKIIPYPNPINGSTLHFSCTGRFADPSFTRGYQVCIYSLPGVEVYSGELHNQVGIGNISPGLYIVTVKDRSGQVISVSKLIKN